jgi:hypothetical protein
MNRIFLIYRLALISYIGGMMLHRTDKSFVNSTISSHYIFFVFLVSILVWVVFLLIEKRGHHPSLRIKLTRYPTLFSILYSLVLTGIYSERIDNLSPGTDSSGIAFFYLSMIVFIFLLSQFLLCFRENTSETAAVHGLLAAFVINSSRWNQLGDDLFSQVAFSIILAAIAGYACTLYKNKLWKKYIPGKVELAILMIIALINTLIVMYNKLRPELGEWFNPLTIVAIFVLTLLFLLITQVCLLHIIDTIKQKISSHDPKKGEDIRITALWLICFFSMSGIWGFYFIGANPGIMTPDSLSQWNQAGGVWQLNNLFPVLYVFFIKLCRLIWDSPVSVIIIQIMIISAMFSTIFLFFHRHGLSVKAVLVLTFIFAIFLPNGLMVISIGKDSFYGASFAMFFYFVLKYIWDKRSIEDNWFNLLGLFFSIVMTGLLRHNGTVFIYLATIILLVITPRNKTWKTMAVALLACGLITLINGPIYTRLGVVKMQDSFVTRIPIHDIATVFYDGGDISEETHLMLTDIMPTEYWIKRFNRYNSDTYAYPLDGDPAYKNFMEILNNVSIGHVLKLYIDTFLQSPMDIVRARLSLTPLVWNYTRLDGYHDTLLIYDTKLMSTWAQNWGVTNISWNENSVTRLINSIANFTGDKNLILHFSVWRIGIVNFIIEVVAYFWFLTKKSSNLLLIFLYGLSGLILIVSMPAPDFRYIYPHFLAAMIIIISSVLIEEDIKTVSKHTDIVSLTCEPTIP